MTRPLKLEISAQHHEAKENAHRSLSDRLRNLNDDRAHSGVDADDFNADWHVDVNEDGAVEAVIEVTVFMSGVPEADFIEHLHNHGFSTNFVENHKDCAIIRLRDERTFGEIND